MKIGTRYSRAVTSKRTAALDVLIEQATVDAYGDDEQGAEWIDAYRRWAR